MAARRARELPLALVVAARPAAPGHAACRARRRARVRAARAGAALRGRHRAAGRGDARAPGVGGARRAGARGDPRQPAVSARAARPRRTATRSTTAARRRSSCGSSRTGSSGSRPPRPRSRARSRCWAPTPTSRGRARSPGSSRPRRSPPRRSCAASACSTRARTASRTRWSPRRRARRSARWTPPSCTRARPRCSPTTGLDDQRVAEHLMRAPPRGDPDVVASLRRAADAARRLGALTDRGAAARARHWPSRRAPDARRRGRLRARAGAARRRRRRTAGGCSRASRSSAPDPSLRVDAARHLAMRLALGGRGADAVAVLRTVLETLPDTAPRGAARSCSSSSCSSAAPTSSGYDEAMRTIAAEAARVTGRTPGERLVMVAAHVMRGEQPVRSRRAPPGSCSAGGCTVTSPAASRRQPHLLGGRAC